MLASQTQDSAALHAAPASQAGSSRSGGPNGTPAPPASTAPPLRGSRPAMSGLQKPRRCTCICASSMPMAAGFADGRLVIWDWREPEGAPVGGAQAAPHPN